jgi:hypothetical protein
MDAASTSKPQKVYSIRKKLMTAQDVTTAVGHVGAPYKAYEQLILDNNVHAKMTARVAAKPEAEASAWLVELGIVSYHRARILIWSFSPGSRRSRNSKNGSYHSVSCCL